jgi:hypothetical protein
MLTGIEKLKPKEKAYKISDGNRLNLLVEPGGGKLWRLRYQFGGKEKILSLGSFPAVSLADARAKRDEAHKQVANGIDPSDQKKQDKPIAEISREKHVRRDRGRISAKAGSKRCNASHVEQEPVAAARSRCSSC